MHPIGCLALSPGLRYSAGVLRPEPEQLGARIRELRYRRGLTQAQLAYKAGVGEKTLKRVESGHTEVPRPATLAALAGALGVAVAALLEPADEAPGSPALHQLPRPPQNFTCLLYTSPSPRDS